MEETIQIGEIVIALTRKNIKHVHLSVHPPLGRVSMVAPTGTRLEVARAYAISKIGWIREQQAKLQGQARVTSVSTRSLLRSRRTSWSMWSSTRCCTSQSLLTVNVSLGSLTSTIQGGVRLEPNLMLSHSPQRNGASDEEGRVVSHMVSEDSMVPVIAAERLECLIDINRRLPRRLIR